MEKGITHGVDRTPQSEPAESKESLHDKFAERIVNTDFVDTVGRNGIDHIPHVFLRPLGQYLGSEEDFTRLRGKYPPFTIEEQREIIETSRENAAFFAEKGDQRRAVEARRMGSIFIEWAFKGGAKGMTDNWGSQKLGEQQISDLRREYIKGDASNLKEYVEYEQTARENDTTTESAQNTIEIFRTIRKLGIKTFAQALDIIGMDRSMVNASVQAAVENFKSIQDDLDAEIAKLVTDGLIPQDKDVIKSYAAYSMAAASIDKENMPPQTLSAQEIFTQFAQRENVSVPDRSVLVLPGIIVQGGIPRTSSLAWIDENGKITVGAVIRLPKGIKDNLVCHESAHALSALIVANEKDSPLLAVAQATRENEKAGTYGGSVGQGGNSYATRLELTRYALLNQAQLRKIKALDTACLAENVEEVDRILKEDLTSQEIKDTFGKPVKGEGRGLYIGVFSAYASASEAIQKVKKGITLQQLVTEICGLPTPQAA